MAVVCRLISCGVVLAATLLFAASAAAQGVGGSIVGTVTDQTQGVLPGVTVTVTGPALMGTRNDVTAADGTYRLPNLPPGSGYVVVFELSGFSNFKREGIRLDVGFTATINATLSTAGARGDRNGQRRVPGRGRHSLAGVDPPGCRPVVGCARRLA